MIRPLRSLLALATAGALALGGALLAPTAALAAPAPVEDSTMSWGFLGSWREYVAGPIARGLIEAVAPAAKSGANIDYVGGAGEFDAETGTGVITYQGGMHSQGHFEDATGAWGLDQTLAAPQIQLTSATTGTLSFEVTQVSYSGFPSRDGTREVIADLTFDAGDIDDGVVRAAATMTEAGSVVFGPANASYNPGSPLDPVTFTLPVDGRVAEETTTVLSAPASVAVGEDAVFTATVSPAAPGTVEFTQVGTGNGWAASTDTAGTANVTVSGLTRGTHQFVAEFTPTDANAFLGSTSATVEVAVGAAAETTTITLRTSPTGNAVQGEPVEFIATLDPADAEGTVQFASDTGTLGDPVDVVEGSASLTTLALPVGQRTLTAAFISADAAAWTNATSETVQLTVAAEEESKTVVSGGDLSWGVLAPWWTYVEGPIAGGKISAEAPATLGATGTNSVNWVNQDSQEEVDLVNGSGTITYRGAMVSRGHTGHGESGWGLDQRFSDPQIRLTSTQTAKLSVLVSQSPYTVFPAYDGQRVEIADLRFTASALRSGTVIASARMTADGGRVYGNFKPEYSTGAELLPVSFSINQAAVPQTGVALSASDRSITAGSSVTVTARTTPASLGGTVTFSRGGTTIKRVAVNAGKASAVVTGLPVGDHSITARFDPSSSGHAWSSASTTVTVVAAPPAPPATGGSGQQAGSLAWGISSAFASYVTGSIAKGSIATSGVGSARGAYLFPQATGGSWNSATQTGSVQYSGTVTFSGHKGLLSETFSNPVITVTNPSSGTISVGGQSFGLNLAAASKSVGAGGEVTWTGVPVSGSISGGPSSSSSYSLGVDPLSFTVGSPSSVSYGSTVQEKSKPERTPAATPPATTGITVLTDPEKIRAGGRIEIEAYGFDANDEGVLVVLYSEPILLDDSAKADARGRVTWSGTLPDDVIGEHTLTLQGSTNAGAIIDILDPDEKKKAATKRPEIEQGIQAEAIQAAGPLTSSGGMQLWEWWASAGALVLIAACTTALAIRQRRLNS
ncbi:MAG: HtaA domain-containing protein [Leucobacter sp.]